MTTVSQPFSDSPLILSTSPVDPMEILRAREAAFVAWQAAWDAMPKYDKADYPDTGYEGYKEEHAVKVAELKRLDAAWDALTEAYMESLRDCLAWKQAAKDAQPAAPVIVETPVRTSRIHGRVDYLNERKGYGRIIADSGESFYFHKVNLEHSYAEIRKGDAVTFQRTQHSAHSQPKATLIRVDGFVPAAKEAYQPPQERVTEAQAVVQAQRTMRRQKNAAKRENARRNEQSMAQMSKGKGQAS